MTISNISSAVNDLELKMEKLDSVGNHSWFNNNSFCAKWRNGKAARSAVNLSRLLQEAVVLNTQIPIKELKEVQDTAKRLFRLYDLINKDFGFKRTTLRKSRLSNTEVCLRKAINSLNEFLARSKELRPNGLNSRSILPPKKSSSSKDHRPMQRSNNASESSRRKMQKMVEG